MFWSNCFWRDATDVFTSFAVSVAVLLAEIRSTGMSERPAYETAASNW